MGIVYSTIIRAILVGDKGGLGWRKRVVLKFTHTGPRVFYPTFCIISLRFNRGMWIL
jgi:hypothetical protein